MFGQHSPLKRWYLITEYVILFFGLPTACMFNFFPIYPIFALWIFSIVCVLGLIFDPQFKTSHLWRVRHWRDLTTVVIRFILAAALLGGYVVAFEPNLLFNFPRYRPHTWAMVMFLYPLLSALPQGITHRAFLFQRYRRIFKGGSMIFASAAAFSFMHIVFKNPLALLLTFAGGVLFAKTYSDTRSLMISMIEHALYGNYIFTIGLGKYLYLGAAGYGLSGLP
jgi:membrane protease YdiL (CAAX protease family)